MQKIKVTISTDIDLNIYKALSMISSLYHKAETIGERVTYRKVFDAFIDSLEEEDIINDNQVTFFELWLLTK